MRRLADSGCVIFLTLAAFLGPTAFGPNGHGIEAHATNATTLICGPDPAILTPLHPTRAGVSGPELTSEPDVTFTFEGQKPCIADKCRIAVRHGVSKKLIAAIRLPSDDITYCRDRRPFIKWPWPPEGQRSRGCLGEVTSKYRSIIFGKDLYDIDALDAPGIRVSLFQNAEGEGRLSSSCAAQLYGKARVPPGFLRFRTEHGGLLQVYERSTRDDVDPSHRHVSPLHKQH